MEQWELIGFILLLIDVATAVCLRYKREGKVYLKIG